MPLSADDEQAAQRADFFRLGRNLRFIFIKQFAINDARVEHFLRHRHGRTDRKSYDFFVIAIFLHFLTRHEFWVSAEHNVGSAPRHVGRYGNLSQTSRARDDFRFFFVILGV